MNIEIGAHDGVINLLNLFHVKPEQADEFIVAQLDQTTNYRLKRPGFIASAFHRSGDSSHILNFARWESVEHVQETLNSADFSDHNRRLADFEYDAKMRLYETELMVNQPVVIEQSMTANTAVQILSVNPQDHERLMDAARSMMSNLDRAREFEDLQGALLLRGIKRDHIALYWQWGSAASFDSFRRGDHFRGFRDTIASLSTESHFDRYTVVSVLSRDDKG